MESWLAQIDKETIQVEMCHDVKEECRLTIANRKKQHTTVQWSVGRLGMSGGSAFLMSQHKTYITTHLSETFDLWSVDIFPFRSSLPYSRLTYHAVHSDYDVTAVPFIDFYVWCYFHDFSPSCIEVGRWKFSLSLSLDTRNLQSRPEKSF